MYVVRGTLYVMKILVFGDGWMSNKFISKYPDEAVLTTVDATDPQAVANILDDIDPDCVLNGAGITGQPNVDWCETNQLATAVGNTLLPLVLARACGERAMHFTHLGSGCIFYGDSPTPGGWKEYDYPNPVAYYSKTKAAADMVLGNMPNVAVVRLRLPMDSRPSPKNTITKLANYPKIVDVANSITVVEDLLDVLHQVMDKRATGIFHAVNPEPLAYRDLMKWYEEIVDPDHHNEWVNEDELLASGSIAKKRSSCLLAGTRLAEFGIEMRHTEDAIKECLRAYRA